MNRFTDGYVRWYRRAFFDDIGTNIHCLGLWVALLSIANWKPSSIIWKGHKRELQPGEMVIGLREFSEKLQCSKDTVSRWLAYLCRTDRVAVDHSTRGTLITILNWASYQGSIESDETQIGRHSDARRTLAGHGAPPLVGQQPTLSKERRREEGKKKKRIESDSGLPALAEIWNQNRDPRLPAVERMNPSGKRYRACVTRWESNPDRSYWETVIGRINASSFCLGGSDRGWKADIEFLCRPDSAEKVLEGKYDGTPGAQQSGPVPRDPELERMEAEYQAARRLA